MSRAYNGGSNTYSTEDVPSSEEEVLDILERFIKDEFRSGDSVASDVREQAFPHLTESFIIFFADDSEQESPATLGQREDDLIAYGAFAYPARDHPVQTIWDNQFEIRETDRGDVYVGVSDWFGTTVETWNRKVEKQSLYV